MTDAASFAPIAFGLLAAAFFALGSLTAKMGLRTTGSIVGTQVSIGFSVLVFWLASPFFLKLGYWASPAVWVFALIGCFQPIVSANFANAGTHLLGPTVSATVASISPLFAVAGGVLLLSEALTLPIVVGTAGIVLGVMALSWQGPAGGNWLRLALLLPVGAALLRALAHVMAKGALVAIPSPLLGGLVGYSVSFLIGLVFLLPRLGKGPGLALPGRAATGWFLASGCINASGIICLYAGLQYGRVVLVSPVVASAPLFTLLFSRLFFRVEVINRRTLAGVLLIVPGVIVISLFR